MLMHMPARRWMCAQENPAAKIIISLLCGSSLTQENLGMNTLKCFFYDQTYPSMRSS